MTKLQRIEQSIGSLRGALPVSRLLCIIASGGAADLVRTRSAN